MTQKPAKPASRAKRETAATAAEPTKTAPRAKRATPATAVEPAKPAKRAKREAAGSAVKRATPATAAAAAQAKPGAQPSDPSAPRTSGHPPTYNEISQRAYFISLEEGGDEVANWLRAEGELTMA